MKPTKFTHLLVSFFALASLCLAQVKPEGVGKGKADFVFEEGAIIRGDTTAKKLALVFTGDEFADGAETILRVLKQEDLKASFFSPGGFTATPPFDRQFDN